MSWVTRPVEDAVADWRRQRRVRSGCVVAASLLAVAGLAAAAQHWTAVQGDVRTTGTAIAELEGGRAEIRLDDAPEVTVIAGDDEHPIAVGERVPLSHPPGQPARAASPDELDLLIAAVAFAAVVAVGAGVWFHYRPWTEQIRLAEGTGGSVVQIVFSSDNGRWLLIDAGPELALDGRATLPVGGGKRPLPVGGAVGVNRGELVTGGVAVVQIGDELVNTYGRVRRPVVQGESS